MYDTIWNILAFSILFVTFCLLMLLCILPIIIYSKFLKKRNFYYSLSLILYPIILTLSGKYLIGKGKTLLREDLDFRVENDLETHLLSLTGGFEHRVAGSFLQLSSYPIYIIIAIIIVIKIIEIRKSSKAQ